LSLGMIHDIYMKNVRIGHIFWFSLIFPSPRLVETVWCALLTLFHVWIVLFVSSSFANPTEATYQLEWIDVHVHLVGGRGQWQDYQGAVRAAFAVMEETGIKKMVIMPPPQVYNMPQLYDYDSFVKFVKQHSMRFAFLGGGGTLNAMLHEAGQNTNISDSLRHKFEEKAIEIIQQGAVGFGEIAVHHLSLMSDHPYESVPADHPLLLLLADIAAQHDVVIDIHFDPVTEDMKSPEWLESPPNPSILRANLSIFERLLEHNRKAKIVWAHAGSDQLGHWTTKLSQRLLKKHPNLHMSLRIGPGRAPQNHPLTPGGAIKQEWLQLLQDFPTRFVIGSDQFIVSPSIQGRGPGSFFSQRAPKIRERTRMFLSTLPPDVARRVSYENAIHLYRLEVKKSSAK